MRLRGSAVLVAVLVLVAALLSPRVGAASPGDRTAEPVTAVVAPAYPVGGAGRWLVDATGRVYLPHGVNVSATLGGLTPQQLGFGDQDAAIMQSFGLSTVRLTVIRSLVEPEAGQFDESYLTAVRQTVQMLATHGITTLIDFHVGEYGADFGQLGYPDWMTVTDGLTNRKDLAFPDQFFGNPALNRAYDHLWDDDPDSRGVPLQTDDAELLAHVARELASQPSVLGYEIQNEPWGGTTPDCNTTGCPTFDTTKLAAYDQRMATAIRAADPAHLVLYEPLLPFSQGVPTAVPVPTTSKVAFAFHVYPSCDQTAMSQYLAAGPVAGACATEVATTIAHALAYGAGRVPLIDTEVGATHSLQWAGSQLDALDSALLPWIFWQWGKFVVSYTASGTLDHTPTSVAGGLLTVLGRPSLELVSGTPTSAVWSESGSTWTGVWSTERADGAGRFPAGSETDLAVPPAVYAGGYAVQVTGGRATSAPGAAVLRIASCPGAREVSLGVQPGHGVTGGCGRGGHLLWWIVGGAVAVVVVAAAALVRFRRRNPYGRLRSA